MRVGILVNPIAGMGGSVGLKGTDGKETLDEAVRRGAVRIAGARMAAALASADLSGSAILTCGGEMGSLALRQLGLTAEIVYEPNDPTTPQDTVSGARRLLQALVDIILFAGGDGTANDLMGAIDESVPVLGVPAGVKMHSAVFANSPR